MKKLILVLIVLGVCLVPAVAKAEKIEIGSFQFLPEGEESAPTFYFVNVTGDSGLMPLYWCDVTFNEEAFLDVPAPYGGQTSKTVDAFTPATLSLSVGGDDQGPFTQPFRLTWGGSEWLVDPHTHATLDVIAYYPDLPKLGNWAVVELQATPIPEPASLLLLGTGLAAAVRARRRR